MYLVGFIHIIVVFLVFVAAVTNKIKIKHNVWINRSFYRKIAK